MLLLLKGDQMVRKPVNITTRPTAERQVASQLDQDVQRTPNILSSAYQCVQVAEAMYAARM